MKLLPSPQTTTVKPPIKVQVRRSKPRKQRCTVTGKVAGVESLIGRKVWVRMYSTGAFTTIWPVS